jgi:hypothetical protein
MTPKIAARYARGGRNAQLTAGAASIGRLLKKVELGAEVQQPRAVSRRLAGRHTSRDQESILAELGLSKK